MKILYGIAVFGTVEIPMVLHDEDPKLFIYCNDIRVIHFTTLHSVLSRFYDFEEHDEGLEDN